MDDDAARGRRGGESAQPERPEPPERPEQPEPPQRPPEPPERPEQPERPERPGVYEPPAARGGRRGRATRRLRPHDRCLNCGDPTPGEYCRGCGQRKVDVQVSLRAMLADLLEDELTVDRRLPATFFALLFRPGQLTLEYVNGRIVRYIRPFRLYLVSSLVFFLLLSFTSLRFIRGQITEGASLPTVPDAVTLAELDSAHAALTALLADPALPGVARVGLRQSRAQIERQRAAVQAREAAAGGGLLPEAARDEAPDVAPESTAEETVTRPDDTMAFLDGVRVNTGFAAVDTILYAKLQELRQMQPRQAAERLIGDFIGYIPTLVFLLLPVFAGVLKLLYIRRRRYYAEHFIFLLHTHAVIYLVFTLMLLLLVAGWLRGWVLAGLYGWLGVYVLLAMRRVYGQGWLKTVAKWWTLGWMYFWILALALPIAVVVTLLLL
jgi:hypothetical protein